MKNAVKFLVFLVSPLLCGARPTPQCDCYWQMGIQLTEQSPGSGCNAGAGFDPITAYTGFCMYPLPCVSSRSIGCYQEGVWYVESGEGEECEDFGNYTIQTPRCGKPRTVSFTSYLDCCEYPVANLSLTLHCTNCGGGN